ncbi:MAG: cytochrome c3 family protein [Anaerolineales bacterium]
MNSTTSLLKHPLARVGVIIFALIVMTLIAAGIRQNQAVPEQPIQFPHNLHVGLGIQCLYCHPGAARSPNAGLPTQNKCWGCHQQIAKQTPELAKLAQYVQNNQPIPWVPVAIMPDFVRFNHRPHIAAGLNCETCHGDMSKVTIAQNPQVMNMGWCLNCHREMTQNDPVKREKLLDCSTCHY